MTVTYVNIQYPLHSDPFYLPNRPRRLFSNSQSYMFQMMRALEFCHGRGIMHR